MCTHAIYERLWHELQVPVQRRTPAPTYPPARFPRTARRVVDLTYVRSPRFPTWLGSPCLERDYLLIRHSPFAIFQVRSNRYSIKR